jgi:dTDP-4-amino-4,6-dideoxygalactose transaminase
MKNLPALLGGNPIRPNGPPGWPPDRADVRAAVEAALADGSWGLYDGPHSLKLTDCLAADHACEHVVLCSSGTVAVELALRGVPVGDGDEVILAGYDFAGNMQNVLAVGARPVLVDIDPQTGTMDASQLAEAITSNTKAVLVSHLHGGMANLPAIVEIAHQHSLIVIEDACQMPGAKRDGRLAGSFGDVGLFSFGGSKLITAGRGGALITHDASIAQRIRLYRIRGNNAYPLSELQAAAILPQWQRLDTDNNLRALAVASLIFQLPNDCGLTPFRNPPGDLHASYYKLGFWYSPECLEGLSRETFARAMRAEGIAMDPGFRGLHLSHAKRRFRAVGDLAYATRADSNILTLHHPMLLEGEIAVEEFLAVLEKIRQHADRLRELVQE